jgi:hypothetical protein
MFSLDALFCDVDDFCLVFEPEWQKKLLNYGGIKRCRAKSLCLSEIMTILIAFHQNHFFAKPRRNMKNKLMCLHDKLLSRQRSIIETINDQLKNISQIEHSRHRSPVNFCVNILCGLTAYCHQPKKPSLRLDWLLPQSA